MGAPQLKKKAALDYRRGSAGRDCSSCVNFVPAFPIREANGTVHVEPRCRVMGIQPGRAYRISSRSICNAFKGGER